MKDISVVPTDLYRYLNDLNQDTGKFKEGGPHGPIKKFLISVGADIFKPMKIIAEQEETFIEYYLMPQFDTSDAD